MTYLNQFDRKQKGKYETLSKHYQEHPFLLLRKHIFDHDIWKMDHQARNNRHLVW